MSLAGRIRIEIEYPIFKKIREEEGETVSLDEVRKILSRIKGSLAEEVLKERDEEWR
ncbi:MAG: hypothetical protein J7K36_04560 [Archaeoglobaceae archaeon]|nr:hypothetical protein [Archaeoglobaceae archaeon]